MPRGGAAPAPPVKLEDIARLVFDEEVAPWALSGEDHYGNYVPSGFGTNVLGSGAQITYNGKAIERNIAGPPMMLRLGGVLCGDFSKEKGEATNPSCWKIRASGHVANAVDFDAATGAYKVDTETLEAVSQRHARQGKEVPGWDTDTNPQGYARISSRPILEDVRGFGKWQTLVIIYICSSAARQLARTDPKNTAIMKKVTGSGPVNAAYKKMIDPTADNTFARMPSRRAFGYPGGQDNPCYLSEDEFPLRELMDDPLGQKLDKEDRERVYRQLFWSLMDNLQPVVGTYDKEVAEPRVPADLMHSFTIDGFTTTTSEAERNTWATRVRALLDAQPDDPTPQEGQRTIQTERMRLAKILALVEGERRGVARGGGEALEYVIPNYVRLIYADEDDRPFVDISKIRGAIYGIPYFFPKWSFSRGGELRIFWNGNTVRILAGCAANAPKGSRPTHLRVSSLGVKLKKRHTGAPQPEDGSVATDPNFAPENALAQDNEGMDDEYDIGE